MPEGPEIRRLRNHLAEVLEGRRARHIRFYLPRLTAWNGPLDGRRILAIESRGKALLTHLDDGHSIYSHNQLYGRWLTSPAGERPECRRQLRLAIHTAHHSAWLFSASSIEVWPTDQLHRQPLLARLGPDLLDETTDAQCLRRRLTDRRWHGRQLGALLTDQGFVAGLGNYLRCEILHLARLHPRLRPRDLDDGALESLIQAMLELPRRSLATGGITNEPARAQALMAAGSDFEGARFWVFRRAGRPCYRCATPIERRQLNGQPCYLCPNCQKAPG